MDNVPTPTEGVGPAGFCPPEALPFPENARPFVAVENAEQQARCSACPGKPLHLVENHLSQTSAPRRRYQEEQAEIGVVRLGVAERQIADGNELTLAATDPELQRRIAACRGTIVEEGVRSRFGRQAGFEKEIVRSLTIDGHDGIEIAHGIEYDESDRR